MNIVEWKGRRPGEGSGTASPREASRRGRLLAEARMLADSVPEVRRDREIRIRAALQRGTYRVDGGKIADRMIGDALRELRSRMQRP
ncbi:MAG TPA: flagellar biosynthesis anti-sigma factor FlgM [Candidatus Aquicultoraceae bacterium]|nr:flagellar biosynthesis anti-sigma factor FlgM [Candidatus Aquicultoraceae bacterium]